MVICTRLLALLTARAHVAVFLAAVAVLLAAQCADAAGTSYSFATTPGRLPKSVVPAHYAITLEPDLEHMTLTGSETVDIDVLEPTARLVVNAVDMTLAAVSLDDIPADTIALDAPTQTASLTWPSPIATGRHQLRISFAARINTFGRGLFAVDYPTAQGRKRMIASHLEPADARRIFPCWDEPSFKASFELTVTLPREFNAVSNMPIVREDLVEEASEPAMPIRRRLHFAPTPRMSSYLFVLAAGELERMTGAADGVAISVVTTAGKAVQGRFALDSAIKLLTFYNEYFGFKYPLPKLDLIAVPGVTSGAMENWGGITFFESLLLFDPEASGPNLRRRIFIILAHEMAHLWFGDLVTMAWWDDLWLNEGFASWMQLKAADRIHPEWRVWLNETGSKQFAMNQDARRTTHPIEQPVGDESEAMTAFDAITYTKGQAFIRMLEDYLTPDVFRAGIRRYMKIHAFSNATTADLWRALETASGQAVAPLAAAYTAQPGVPLVVTETSCDGDRQRLVLRNQRFTLHDPDARPLQWPVPVVFGHPGGGEAPRSLLLDEPTRAIDVGRCGEPVKLNLGDVGYYRVQYDAATLATLAGSLPAMAPADRVNLLADSWALVEAGRLAPQAYLGLVDHLRADDARAAWDQVLGILYRIDYLERGQAGRRAFQAYARARLRPVFDRLGWEAAAAESADDALLRPSLIRALGHFGDEDILATAGQRFAGFLADPATLRAGLREPVTYLAGRHASRATYDALLRLARATTNADERVRYYLAAAASLEPTQAEATLAIALTDELPPNLVGSLIGTVASAGEHPDLALTFVTSNFAALAARQGPQFRDTFVPNLMTNFVAHVRADELTRFAPAQETAGGRTVTARAVETIRANADLRDALLPAVDDWVRDQAGRQWNAMQAQ